MGMIDLLHSLHPNAKKKYRIVLDGNGDFRIQYKFEGGAMTTSQVEQWHFEDRKFKSAEEAEHAIGEHTVVQIIKDIN